MALRTERQSARMSKIKNGGLEQYGAGPFEQQQFGTAGVEGVKKKPSDFNPDHSQNPTGSYPQINRFPKFHKKWSAAFRVIFANRHTNQRIPNS